MELIFEILAETLHWLTSQANKLIKMPPPGKFKPPQTKAPLYPENFENPPLLFKPKIINIPHLRGVEAMYTCKNIQETTTATQGLPCLDLPRFTRTNNCPSISSSASASEGCKIHNNKNGPTTAPVCHPVPAPLRVVKYTIIKTDFLCLRRQILSIFNTVILLAVHKFNEGD